MKDTRSIASGRAGRLTLGSSVAAGTATGVRTTEQVPSPQDSVPVVVGPWDTGRFHFTQDVTVLQGMRTESSRVRMQFLRSSQLVLVRFDSKMHPYFHVIK